MTDQRIFNKILVANRGEIAIRILRACRELGIRTVAVYSSEDAAALHVRLADQAVLLGAPEARESYLNGERIIAAALETGAEAIHPGYGFLSENADFAAAVSAAGLTFIGPPASVIQIMGDKAASKLWMKTAGIPTIPGAENLPDLDAFLAAGEQIGYPVLIKAAAGGGGKGMHVVTRPEEMPEAVISARREATNAFKDDRLLLEKFLPDARHIEFQVLGDQHGNLLHLFERDCSTQRRHQKIIEETPSPLLDADLRRRMGEAALTAAAAVHYINAGTVEFIVNPATREFYFLEMNPRLQVEHPVTEFVVGLDLVQWQIRIAAGEKLPYKQQDLSQRGHAIECRIYAEEPGRDFMPGTGQILTWIEPAGPGIRLDSGVKSGSVVSHYYDPLLAKLIVYAENRESAIRRMQLALNDFIVHGVQTNLDFLQMVLRHPDFQAGVVTTRWVESVPDLGALNAAPPLEAWIAAALAENNSPSAQPSAAGTPAKDPFSPWEKTDGFRLRN